MSERIGRKKKVHGGHRGSATRLLNETIEFPADRNSVITTMQQCKLLLAEKLVVIKQQDEEILALVDDEEVEHEIEEADVFSGRV